MGRIKGWRKVRDSKRIVEWLGTGRSIMVSEGVLFSAGGKKTKLWVVSEGDDYDYQKLAEMRTKAEAMKFAKEYMTVRPMG